MTTATTPTPRATAPHGAGPDRLKVLFFVLAVLSPFLIYLGTANSMVRIWDSSETFAHGYVILPISLWLIWRRRATLAGMSPVPCWPAMLLLVGCGFGWLLADLADVQVVRQYTFVAMLPLVVLALLGWRFALLLCFPLLFLLLAVPFGEVFTDTLIDHTADFTVMALQATGIPVLREGSNFSLPTGNWSVVEACSGLRYLIASITLGLLYAYLTYRSNLRRTAFVIMAIIVPIVANWLRAYMIVMIGHLSGMELATGVDHIIYGWLFFGVVMFLMFWVGSYWRQDPLPEPVTQAVPQAVLQPALQPEAQSAVQSGPAAQTAAARPRVLPVSNGHFITAALVAIACVGIWPLYESWLDRISGQAPGASVAAFQSDWQEVPAFTDWKAGFFTPNAQFQRYFEQGGRKAGLALLYYRNQSPGSSLISSSNIIAEREGLGWRTTGASGRAESFGGRTIALRETRIRRNDSTMLVWDWYWIDGRFTSNNYLGKLLQARERLLLRGDDGASIQVFAAYEENPEVARAAMRDFLAANLDRIEATLVANRQR